MKKFNIIVFLIIISSISAYSQCDTVGGYVRFIITPDNYYEGIITKIDNYKYFFTSNNGYFESISKSRIKKIVPLNADSIQSDRNISQIKKALDRIDGEFVRLDKDTVFYNTKTKTGIISEKILTDSLFGLETSDTAAIEDSKSQIFGEGIIGTGTFALCYGTEINYIYTGFTFSIRIMQGFYDSEYQLDGEYIGSHYDRNQWTEIGFLFGYSVVNRKGMFYLKAGFNTVNSSFIYSSSSSLGITSPAGNKAGFTAECGAMMSFSKAFGLGIKLFSNINSTRSTLGICIVVSAGKLW